MTLADFHEALRDQDLLMRLIELLNPTEPFEVQEEAAFALSFLGKDCKSFNEISYKQSNHSKTRRNQIACKDASIR